MSQGHMISLIGSSWSIRLRWQWCLCACLAGAIFFVSGCAKVAVPNVEGLTQDAATTAITAAKLKVGTNSHQNSNTVAAGKVISQEPASGSSLAEGSPVNLVISSGPQMVTVPNLDGLTQDAATAALTGANPGGDQHQADQQHSGCWESNSSRPGEQELLGGRLPGEPGDFFRTSDGGRAQCGWADPGCCDHSHHCGET